MFGFYLKKNLCDIWDNLFHLFVINIITDVLIGICVALVMLGRAVGQDTSIPQIYSFIAVLLSSIILSVFIFAEGDNAFKIADFETPKFSLYFKNLLPSLKDGALFGLFITILISIGFVTLPYYFRVWIPEDGSQGSFLGLMLMSLVFWFLVITLLSLQWFLPIRSIMHNNFLKCLKKSYILFFDNAGFTLLMGINNLLILALSVFMLGLAPGLHGITVMNTNALRLRLYKYDWIEVNPGMTKEQRRQVPWAELIAKDKRTLGPRKFKSFLFPWKE